LPTILKISGFNSLHKDDLYFNRDTFGNLEEHVHIKYTWLKNGYMVAWLRELKPQRKPDEFCMAITRV